MDCYHEIVHISHSQTLNPTIDRGHHPKTRFSGQRSPFQLIHVGFHTFPPSSRSVDQTVHRFSQSHTLMMFQSQCLCQFCDRFAVQLLISHRPFLPPSETAVVLTWRLWVTRCGSVNPCITRRAFSESSDFLVMTQRIRIKLLHCSPDLVAASTAACLRKLLISFCFALTNSSRSCGVSVLTRTSPRPCRARAARAVAGVSAILTAS